jgi:hypothetical protein
MRIQRRAEELDTPFCPEGVQGRLIWKAVPHRCGKLREEGRRIKGWSYEDILAGGRIGHIDEAVRCAARNADNITRLREEAPSVDLVKIASLDDTKDFRLPVAMLRRPFPGALIVSMKQNSPSLVAGGSRTKRSSPMAGIFMGDSVAREWAKDKVINSGSVMHGKRKDMGVRQVLDPRVVRDAPGHEFIDARRVSTCRA